MSDLLASIDEHLAAVESLKGDAPIIRRVAERIVEIIRDGGTVYVLGNGGSAADAQHIAAELQGRFKRDRRALPVVALTTDTSILTAVANDLGADYVFVRQVEALVGAQDGLWVLSVSGTSPNVVAAVELARQRGACVLGFTGRSGGRLVDFCNECLCADHAASDRVQEVHELAYHLVCEMVEEAFA
ncbi:MAG: SIS domain-containing protein [Phycisphaerae bacterium]|nr:SIS domain-containing protein [Phycisphaerae bacterium]